MFIDSTSASTLQLAFQKLPPRFWSSIQEEYIELSEKILKYFYIFLLYICVRPNSLHKTQSKQHMATDSM